MCCVCDSANAELLFRKRRIESAHLRYRLLSGFAASPGSLTIYLHQFFCEDGRGVVAGFMFFVASSLA